MAAQDREKVTVIIPCWKRLKGLERVIQYWLNQSEVDEVIVKDNSGGFRTELPVLVLSSNKNLGPQSKFAAAQFAKNEVILFADDDVLAKYGLVRDLLKVYNEKSIVGIMGKCFTGKTYYESKGYRGENIKDGKPIKVDYLCGLVMMAHRKHTFVDTRECPTRFMDDWWWQHELKDISLWVVPTNRYVVLPEDKDKNALHLQPEIKEIREKYFRKWVKNVKS